MNWTRAPELDPKRKHSIEVVVDRLKVRPDISARLAESFETALRLSADSPTCSTCRAAPSRPRKPVVFSSRHACPVCGYSVPTLEPKLFSFNNPAGACPSCDGLGVKQFFDPRLVISNGALSLATGAMRGRDRNIAHYMEILTSLARHYDFDVETAWEDLPQKTRKALLQGSGGESIEFRQLQGNGRTSRKRQIWEGFIRTWSAAIARPSPRAVREELAKYLGTHACPDCAGTRLNRTARFVFVGEHTLPQIAHLSVGDALTTLRSLNLPGWRAEVATRILKDVGDRLRFLKDVGLDYLTLDRSAETLSGGEAQRIRLASQVGSGLTGVMYILDEPSIGLHQRDNARLLGTLAALRDTGNTVIVVEHDTDAILAADHVVDLGPGAGVQGGQIVASGTPMRSNAIPPRSRVST